MMQFLISSDLKQIFYIHLHNYTTKMVSKHVANNYLLSQYVQAILKLLRQKTQIQIGKDVFISTSYTREIKGPNKLF